MKRQAGFTLIELIIVIVILGILAAYAVPKYMSIDKEARIAVVKGLRGSIYAAIDMVHATAIAQGVTGSVNIGGTANITITNSLYPTTNVTGIDATLTSTDGFVSTNNATTATFTRNGAANGLTCYVKYDVSTTPPTVTYNSDGC
jgi:MSHA pilin protein MshA